MKLKLKNPIAFFDLETTGIDPVNDKIVEISILKIYPNGNKELKTKRINPQIPIPPATSAIHGIYDEDVKDEPTLEELSAEIALFLKDTDLGGYNCNRFDIPLLIEELLRIDIDFDLENKKVIDVQGIFHKMEQRTLSAAYQFYCNKTLENAHSAEADTVATFEILEAQLEKYPQLKNDVDFLHDFSSHSNKLDTMGRIILDEKKNPIFNFGKHKGKTVKDVLNAEPSYYNWMMNGDFALHTKKVLTKLKEQYQKK
jgi:DNA polymerase III subunit epsilon